MKSVKISEFKDGLSRFLREVEAGAELEVTDRGRPIARVVPVEEKPRIKWIEATRSFEEVKNKKYPPANWPVDSTMLLLEDRRKDRER